MPAVFRAFQFDNDQIRAFVDAQQIDAPPAVLPFAELFGNHQRIGRDCFNMGLKEALQVTPLAEALLGERGPFEGRDVVVFLSGKSAWQDGAAGGGVGPHGGELSDHGLRALGIASEPHRVVA